jgi:hypothetical protein
VLVLGVDGSYLPQAEVVALDGAGAGATLGSYLDIYRAKVLDSGSDNINAGDITITAAVDGTLQATIPAGKGQTWRAIYTVAAGSTALVKDYYASLLKAGAANPTPQAVVELWVRERLDDPLSTWNVRHVRSAVFSGSSNLPPDPYPYPIKVIGPAQIKMRVFDTTQNASDISAGFNLQKIDNGARL